VLRLPFTTCQPQKPGPGKIGSMAESISKEKLPMPDGGHGNASGQMLNEKLDTRTDAPIPPNVDNMITRDGLRVHPQPTADPLDPLNWSFFQKHTILAIVMFKYVFSF
jgi:hypothetical protein